MSIRHPEFVSLVERCCGAVPREPLSDADVALLEEYAAPVDGIAVEDQLGGATREAVEVYTGRSDVWSPERASRALLSTLGRS